MASLWTCVTAAQQAGPSDDEVQDLARSMGMDPRSCDDIQNRINRVAAIAESSLSDDEKVSRLSEALAESIAGMQKAGQKDDEVAKAVNQYLVLIQDLLSTARASATGDDKKVSAAVKNDLQRLTILTKNYVAMMKLMCPRLALPEAMNK
jgi:DNA repair ATPase RecN